MENRENSGSGGGHGPAIGEQVDAPLETALPGGRRPGKEPVDHFPITDQRMILHGTNQQDDQEEEDKYTSLRRMRKQ